MRSRTSVAAFAAVVSVLAIPAGASAATTKVVTAGTPPAAQKVFQKLQSDVNAFFPGSVTVHAGDSVRFVPAGFHNVDIPARGGKPIAFVSPQGPISGAKDPAGADYWFNGQPNFGITADLVLKQGWGKRFTYTGSKSVGSGLPLARRPKPMTVKFTRTGSVTFLCSIHPGMKGKVKVVGKGKRVPSAKADAKRVAKQIKDGLAEAKRLGATEPTAGTVNLGAGGRGGVEYFDFAPKNVTVARGTTLNFRMTPRSYEAHTATSGPGDPENQSTSFLGKLTASIESPTIDPQAIYPSEAPGQVASLSPSTHGNGFWNTGFLDSAAATPLPASSAVKFDTAGTFTFYCLIHPFMKGTVQVQ